MLFVEGRGEMAVMPAVTAIQLHHSAMDIGIDCNVDSRRQRGNFVYVWSYCSTVTLYSNGYRDLLQCCYYRLIGKWRLCQQLL